MKEKIKNWLKNNWKQTLSITLLILIVSSFILIFNDADAAVKVKGYYRKDGTYVQSHYRSNPDGNPYNNWSFPGNTNPYTGKVAPGNPDTYLENYYGNSGSSYTPSYGGSSTLQTVSTYHYTPSRQGYRLFQVPGTLTVWELSHWQSGGFGTRRAFNNPQAFEARYGRTGWTQIKPVFSSELNKYKEFTAYY